ncbi:serine/threonine-protein kinase [Paraliomyxa miuraensis]|uniref:serine/threonine-protein kinase n=1 Tax=Paraliomyxa miuraensis TaxID=376150 RepID=UPI002253E5CF|nr:serine/threonine-protein kinase [Paraliomyxa miuraensis]MCX4240329.1 serine/threonine-protein kinase [Paraliomyxa miuraensis]
MTTSSTSLTSSEAVTTIDGPTERARPPRPALETPAVGTELGRYVVLDTLGSGGMGVVLRAYDPRLQREVALKHLRSDVLDDGAAERMVREAQAMAQLAHPNVVAVYDVERHESTVLLAMELVQGTTLGKWLRKEALGWPRVLEVFVQAGRGLAAAHAAGLMHRDFKPDNVLVGTDARVRVTDFGLARPMGEHVGADEGSGVRASISGSHGSLRATVTAAGTVMGTPAYMAPEQQMGEEADAKADQYAFCVSLWEALTGKRPFVGDYRQLAVAKTRGPPQWPSGSAVPRKITEAILRGLAPAPSERWPSMDALLERLDLDPARSRLRWITAGAIGVAVLATTGAIAGWWTRSPAVCTGARDHLVGVWDDARREQVSTGLRSTGVEYAETTLAELLPRLDAYADEWAGMHTTACEATSVRGEQSAAVLDLRMGCLRQRLQSLAATAEVLAGADAVVVENAISLTAGLPSLAGCADVDALQTGVAPPEAALAPAVEQARGELARARVIGSVGQHAASIEQLDALSEQALAYEPLRAEVEVWRGHMLLDLRRYEEAERVLEDASFAALRTNHREYAIEALSALGFSLGARRMQEAEGLRLTRTALAMVEPLGIPKLHTLVLNDLAGVLQTHAHHDEAIEVFGRALALQLEQFGEQSPFVTTTMTNLAHSMESRGDLEASFEMLERTLELERRLHGPEHPRVATVLSTLGNRLHQRGDYARSAEFFEQALAMRRALLGPEHPDTAHTLSGLGLALSGLGRNAEAEQRIRESFEILEREVGIENLEVVDTLNNLAIVVDAQGRFEEALELYRRVHSAVEAKLGPDHPRTAQALNNVASELVTLHRFEQALPMLERAVAVLRKVLGPEHPHVGVFELNVADSLLGLGRPAEAEARYRVALPIMEAGFGPDHIYVSYVVVGLGRALHAQGAVADAREQLERGVALQAGGGVPDDDRAEALFALAKALDDDERTRARTLAQQARERFVEAGIGRRRELAEVEDWLASHPAPKP